MQATGGMTKKDDLQKVLHMFDPAQREILLLMKRDSWRRFQSSEEAKTIRALTASLFAHENFSDPDRDKQQAKFQTRFDLMSDETLVSRKLLPIEFLTSNHSIIIVVVIVVVIVGWTYSWMSLCYHFCFLSFLFSFCWKV
jgi:hypothetical protein